MQLRERRNEMGRRSSRYGRCEKIMDVMQIESILKGNGVGVVNAGLRGVKFLKLWRKGRGLRLHNGRKGPQRQNP